MIANFFAKSEPLKTAQLLVLLLGFYIAVVITQEFSVWSWGFFFEKSGLFLLLAFYFLIADFIIRKNYLTADNSFALLLIVLFFGVFKPSLMNNAIILSNVTLLLAFRKVYSLRSAKNIKGKLFDAGFWIGISSLFYVWSIWFVLLVIAGALLYKRHEFRNFFIPIVGAATPILIYTVYHFYYDSMTVIYDRFHWVNEGLTVYRETTLLWPLVLISILVLATIVFVSPKATSQSYNFKSSWAVLFFQLVLAVIVIYFAPQKNGGELLFFFFPLAILIANLLQTKASSVIRNLILYVFLGIVVTGFIYNF